MKWSRFNFILCYEDKGAFIYNSYSNCLLSLTDELYKIFTSFTSEQELGVEGESLFSEDEIQYFKKNYIFVDDDDDLVDILHTQSLSRLFSRNHLVLTIAPTQNCNFACEYCYEKWRHSKAMTKETEDAIVNYVLKENEAYHLDTISLNWYGGEPLLQTERVCSLSKRLCSLGIHVRENIIITNGYFFNERNIARLYEAGIQEIQITLDGDKVTHDRRRPLVNGMGTYDKIIYNLDAYFNGIYRDKFTISLRVNIDKSNCSGFLSIYEWLKNRYKSDRLIVYPGIVVLDKNELKASTCLSRNEATNLFLDLYKKHGILSEKLYPDDISIECSARKYNGNLLIGPDGSVYKCFEHLGNREMIVGDIHSSEIWSNYPIIAKFLVGIDHYNITECKYCSYLPICSGGCPSQRFKNKYKGEIYDCCTPFKGKLKEYLSLFIDINNLNDKKDKT